MEKSVKVKVIVTEFVETDVTHFKSVVQRLTGKDSLVAEEVAAAKEGPRVEGGGGKWKGNVVIEIPPSLEELYDLWAC